MSKDWSKYQFMKFRVSKRERQRIQSNAAFEHSQAAKRSKPFNLSEFLRDRALARRFVSVSAVQGHLQNVNESYSQLRNLAISIDHPQLAAEINQLQQDIVSLNLILNEQTISDNCPGQDN